MSRTMTQMGLSKNEMGAAGSKPVQGTFRWDGEFSDSVREKQFVSDTWGETVARSRAIMLAALLFVVAAGVDYLVLGLTQEFLQLLALRILTLIVAFVPVVLFSDGSDPKALHASMTFTQIYLFSIFLLSALVGETALRDMVVATVVILFAYYIAVPNRLYLNMLVGVGCSFAFGLAIVAGPGISLAGGVVMSLMFGIVNMVGIQLGRLWGKLRRAEYLSLHHHKTMTGRLEEEIAERRIAETEARVSDRNFEGVFRSAPLPLALVRPGETKVLHANRATCDLLGVDAKSIKSFDLKTAMESELSANGVDDIGALLKAHEPAELAITTSDDRKLWVNVTTSAMRYRGAPAILIALHDITQRQMEAEKLRDARDFADAANKSKTEFLANMSHELRTPLNAIIGFSEALEREIYGPLGTDRYREYAQDINNSGIHLLNIINDILDLSKIEAGRFELREDEVELRYLVDGVIRIVAPRAEQANVRLERWMDDEDLVVKCDERAIKQILINLLSNAVKFSPEGAPVRVEIEQQSEALRIAVVDKGIGMAPEDIPRALEPFRQIDGTLARTYEGTGLGLPLARRLSELHGGSLSIESVCGEGTSVFVDLPLERIDATAGMVTAELA
jgi:PAS domain S-box-containing protein